MNLHFGNKNNIKCFLKRMSMFALPRFSIYYPSLRKKNTFTEILVLRRYFFAYNCSKTSTYFFPIKRKQQTHLYGDFAQNAPIVTELKLIIPPMQAAHPRIPSKSKSPQALNQSKVVYKKSVDNIFYHTLENIFQRGAYSFLFQFGFEILISLSNFI